MTYRKQLELLDEKTFVGYTKEDEKLYMRYSTIKINNKVQLALYAGKRSNSYPKKVLPKLYDFQALELGLMNMNGEFISMEEITFDFPKLNMLNKHKGRHTYRFVPHELIAEIYQFLMNHFDERIDMTRKLKTKSFIV